MLSTDLSALADRLAPYQTSGCDMQPVAVALMVATLRDLAERARALEHRPVPPHLTGGALPPGVVRFPGARAA
jgi:hypothetical protein